MNKRYYEHTLPIIRGSLSNTYVTSIQPKDVQGSIEVDIFPTNGADKREFPPFSLIFL